MREGRPVCPGKRVPVRMSVRMPVWVFSLVVPVVLSGCGSCSQDPSQAGFFCGVQNIATGTYERRQSALQHDAAQTEAIAAQQGNRAGVLQSHEEGLAAEEKQRQTQLALLQKQILREREQLEWAKRNGSLDPGIIKQLDGRAGELQRKGDGLSRSPVVTVEEIEALSSENQRLQGEISKLLANAGRE